MTECKKMACLCALAKKVISALNCASPVVPLLARLVVGYVFFNSGLLKLGNWSGTLFLFEHEHPVPFLPVKLAAILGTGTELIAPVLLVAGLGARAAAAALLVMTAVIEFTYQHSMEHAYWGLLLAFILFQGAGKFSADYFIHKKCEGVCKA